MEIEVQRNIFQTIIYDIQTAFDTKDTLDFVNKYSFKKEDMLTTYYDTKNILSDVNLANFTNHINQCLNIYTKQILEKNNYEITRSWIQCYAEGHYHGLHTHGREINEHSIIYYLQCSDLSATTTFFQPGHPYCEGPEINITPSQNKIVMFPSFVPHEVKPNKDKNRIIFSANISVS